MVCLNLVDQSQQSGPADWALQEGGPSAQSVSGGGAAAMGSMRHICFLNIKACKPILVDPKTTNMTLKRSIIGAL